MVLNTEKHCHFVFIKFYVNVKEGQDKLPSMYWLPKLHKTQKARLIANSSSCTTAERSKLFLLVSLLSKPMS